MPVPLFSVGFYTDEKLGAIYVDLTPEEAYTKIPHNVITDPEFRTCGRDETFKNMAGLLIGESFRAVWHHSQYIDKYILITKTGFRLAQVSISPDSLSPKEEIITLGADKELPTQFIHNIVANPAVVQRMSKVKLPSSPDSDDETKPFSYRILCNRNMKFFIYWIKDFLGADKKPLLPV
jgi:hypothetical protein